MSVIRQGPEALTIGIPLHESLAWVENVAGNVRRLAGQAQIVISDPVGADNALELLEAELAGLPGVRFLGRRDMAPGWPPHFNDLMSRAETPLMMWLFHDDEVDRSWIDGGLAALRADRAAVLAVGDMVGIGPPGDPFAGHHTPFAECLALPDPAARMSSAARLAITHRGFLGLAVHGIFRRDLAPPLPVDIPGHRYSDMYWVLAMLAVGPFAFIPGSTYRKRYRPEATHLGWGALDVREVSAPLRAAVREVLEPSDAASINDALWDGDRAGLIDEVERLEARVGELDAVAQASVQDCADAQRARDAAVERAVDAERRLAEAEAECGRLHLALHQVQHSRTWRMAEAFRGARQAMRHPRGSR